MHWRLLILIAILAGCTSSPPKPKAVEAPMTVKEQHVAIERTERPTPKNVETVEIVAPEKVMATPPAPPLTSTKKEVAEGHTGLVTEVHSAKKGKPATITTIEATPDQQIQDQLKALQDGAVQFDPPTKTRVGKPERVTVKIGRKGIIDILQKFSSANTVQKENIKVGTFMTVSLTGNDFKIIPLNSLEQVLPDDQIATWQWDVLPLKPGKKKMNLRVTVRLKVGGSQEMRDYPVFNRDITVDPNWWFSFKQFFCDNWKDLLKGIFALSTSLGLLEFLRRKIKKIRENTETP